MRVLIADDCPITRKLLKKYITEWGFQPVIASDGKQAMAALASKYAPRLAILDWMMPIIDGPSVTKKVRSEEPGPYTYIIMLTAKSEMDDLVSAFGAGIDDYLTKPFNAEELHQRLRAGQRILNLQDQLNHTMEQLRFQATHDALTGLWNRKSIIDALSRELSRSKRNIQTPETTSVVMLDIDRFKAINDTYGHQAGDNVLKSVGDSIRKSLRSYDYVGRYGGEEFIIVLPASSRGQVENVVERIRLDIEQSPIDIGSLEISITASLGVVIGEPDFDEATLIKKADDAMYFAKESGRNRCVFADQLPENQLTASIVRVNPAQVGISVSVASQPSNS